MRIGSGAGFAGDRWEPAVELVEQGALDFIAFECLAERTIARETLAVRRGQGSGYNPQLEDRMRAVLPAAAAQGVRVLSNMGAAGSLGGGAARQPRSRAISGLPTGAARCCWATMCATPSPPSRGLPLMETGAPLESILPRMASANAYLGADAVASALATGAPAVVTGRVADPSLFVGPIVHALGWSYDDYCPSRPGHGGRAPAGMRGPGERRLLRRPRRQGRARIGAPRLPLRRCDRRGRRDNRQVRGQLAGASTPPPAPSSFFTRSTNPAGYVTPDCVLDMTGIAFREVGPDRVAVSGARARSRTATYKVSVGYFDGYLGEGQLSYGGPRRCRAGPGSPAKSCRRGCVCAASPTTPSTPA